MNRRDFLRATATTGGGLALAGLYYGRNLYARSQLEEQLILDSGSVLTKKALAELREIPAKGKVAIQTWFHTPCLAGEEFAFVVTSDDFRQRIANCASKAEEHREFLLAFERHVAPAENILHQVHVIAEELGSELDLNWEACCQTLAEKWNVHVRSYGSALADDFAKSLEPIVRENLQQTLEVVKTDDQRPALKETTREIGKSALMLLPLAQVSATSPIFLPLFVLASVGHLFAYFDGLQNRNRSRDFIRKAVSKRLALLVNRLGTGFEGELRLCVTKLHEWQDGAVKTAASIHAQEAVSVF